MEKRDIVKLLKKAESYFKKGKTVKDFIKDNPKYKPESLLNFGPLSEVENVLIGYISGYNPNFESCDEIYDEIFEYCFEVHSSDKKSAELFCQQSLIAKLKYSDKYSPNRFTPNGFMQNLGTYVLSKNGYKVRLRFFLED